MYKLHVFHIIFINIFPAGLQYLSNDKPNELRRIL